MTVFLSYSHADKSVAHRLSIALLASHVKMWKDEWKLRAGSRLTPEIMTAIGESSYFCMIVSRSSVKSSWVKRELRAAVESEKAQQRDYIIPVVVDECAMPRSIAERVQIDLREDFDRGVRRLVDRVGHKYNTNCSGRILEGGEKDYWFDHLLSFELKGRNRVFCIDLVAHDAEARYCVLAQVRVRLGRGSPRLRRLQADDPEVSSLLRRIAIRFGGRSQRCLVKGNAVHEQVLSLPGDRRQADLPLVLRVARLGSVPSTTQIVPIGAYLLALVRHLGVERDSS